MNRNDELEVAARIERISLERAAEVLPQLERELREERERCEQLKRVIERYSQQIRYLESLLPRSFIDWKE